MKKLLTLLLICFTVSGFSQNWDASTFVVDPPRGLTPYTFIDVHVTRLTGVVQYDAVTMPQRYASGTSCFYMLGQVSQACASHTSYYLNNPVDTVVRLSLWELEDFGDSLLVAFRGCNTTTCTYSTTIKILSPNNSTHLTRCQNFGCAVGDCGTTTTNTVITTVHHHGHNHRMINRDTSKPEIDVRDEYYNLTGQKMNPDYLPDGFYIHVMTSEDGHITKEKILIQ